MSIAEAFILTEMRKQTDLKKKKKKKNGKFKGQQQLFPHNIQNVDPFPSARFPRASMNFRAFSLDECTV